MTALLLPLSASLALVTGCKPVTDVWGHPLYEYFPFDKERTWAYAMDDDSAGYVLAVEKVAATDQQGVEVATLEYRKQDSDLLYSVDWSSDANGGVLIHGYTVQGGDSVRFDTAVQFANHEALAGEQVVTETNGMTFTATFHGIEECPNLWTSEVWDCAHITLDDGDGDDMAGPPFAGDWWGAGSWNASRFHTTGGSADWVLTSAWYCDPEAQPCG
ncbi:hypothetical protein L6R53_15885 [Myxococcota bacterium]|nr:hypothetical protein [Myxococcota bacterium]